MHQDLRSVINNAWSAALGDVAINDETNFFSAGGNSMEAAMMTASVSRAVGERVRMRVLFDAPTFGAYVQAVEAAHATE